MIAIRLYQKKKKLRSDGKAPIYFVLAKGSKEKLISSKKYIDPKYFDNSKGIVTKGAENSIKLNAYFKRKMTELDDIIIDLTNEGKEVTFEKIEKRFTNDFSNDFIVYARKKLRLQTGLISEKTQKGYQSSINNLEKYQSEIPFNSVDHEWLTAYKHYNVTIKKRKTNGYYQDFAMMKKFWKIALIEGETKHNPFATFKLETEDTNRNWHPKEELLMLYNLTKNPALSEVMQARINNSLASKDLHEKERKHLQHFLKIGRVSEAVIYNLIHYLFCCFTGLRMGDKRDFGDKNVINDRIQIKTNKTGTYITIPFNDQAREFLPDILERPLKQMKSRINRELRVAMIVVGIDKHISFHCSRHTFAINCILVGIDILTVRDWLGHKSVTTTEIYAKIAQRYKDENMKKFNNFFSLAS